MDEQFDSDSEFHRRDIIMQKITQLISHLDEIQKQHSELLKNMESVMSLLGYYTDQAEIDQRWMDKYKAKEIDGAAFLNHYKRSSDMLFELLDIVEDK